MIIISTRFNNVEPAKQKRILEAALKEFAEKGFKQASTNQIVKEAGIGKGMLFYYFTNKEGLFHYLVDYAIETIQSEYLSQIDMSEGDFIERLKQITHVKMSYHYANEHVSTFISMIYLDEDLLLPHDLTERLQTMMNEGLSQLYAHVDKSLFRTDIAVDKAFQLIRWTFEGYQMDLLAQLKGKKIAMLDLDPYWNEFYEYLAILKKVYYK